MSPRLLRTVLLTLVAILGGTAAFAHAADLLLDQLEHAPPSASAGLLPPITAEGRVGWTCMAERAARATDLSGADLPADR